MTPLTSSELAELERLDKARTQGRWRSMRDGNQYIGSQLVGASRLEGVQRAWNPHAVTPARDLEEVCRFKDEDADFIAASANALPRLIAEVRELRAGFDANVNRLKACEHIAEGEEGWEALSNLCPSTAAVASLRASNQRMREALEAMFTAWLDYHGRFPLDRTTKEQVAINDAMMKAKTALSRPASEEQKDK